MGSEISMGEKPDDVIPRGDRPPVFDPLVGFANGRKKREMKISNAEMEKYKLTVEERDYCAHKLIDFRKCQLKSVPLANWMCADAHHAYLQCEYEDAIMRMMEFERERRLLERRKRKMAVEAKKQQQSD